MSVGRECGIPTCSSRGANPAMAIPPCIKDIIGFPRSEPEDKPSITISLPKQPNLPVLAVYATCRPQSSASAALGGFIHPLVYKRYDQGTVYLSGYDLDESVIRDAFLSHTPS